jgi:hypothetical protein
MFSNFTLCFKTAINSAFFAVRKGEARKIKITMKLDIVWYWTEVFHFSFAAVTQLELHNLASFNLPPMNMEYNWLHVGMPSNLFYDEILNTTFV